MEIKIVPVSWPERIQTTTNLEWNAPLLGLSPNSGTSELNNKGNLIYFILSFFKYI